MRPIAAPQRILIVSLDNLGDLVFTSALVPPLRDAFPGARIGLWCKTYTADVARLFDGVDDIVAADPPWAVPRHLARPPFAPFLRSIRDVRARRYDVALVTGAPWRTAAAVAATRIGVRIGLARHHNEYFLTHRLAAEDHRKPVVVEQARLLVPLGIACGAPCYTLDRDRALATSVDIGDPAPFAALHPFASDPARCVPIEDWIALADRLRAPDRPILWVGMPAELRALRESLGPLADRFIDQVPHPSLAVTAAALARASVMIGHDSGPLHVAAALGIPVVGIFAPGQPERTFPQGPAPWRMVQAASPREITVVDMQRAIESLGLFSTA